MTIFACFHFILFNLLYHDWVICVCCVEGVCKFYCLNFLRVDNQLNYLVVISLFPNVQKSFVFALVEQTGWDTLFTRIIRAWSVCACSVETTEIIVWFLNLRKSLKFAQSEVKVKIRWNNAPEALLVILGCIIVGKSSS